MLPPAVNVYCSSAIHYLSRFHLLNTSKGCSMPERPPGMTAMSVLVALTALVTPSVKWALNLSHTSKNLRLWRSTGQFCQTLHIHNLHPSSSINPFSSLN